MSRLRILKNPVDGGDEVLHIRTDKVLETFIEVKKKSPQARIFLRPACQQNDVTPSNHIDAASLQMLAKTNDFDIVCEAGEPLTIFFVATAVLSAGLAIYTYLNMPDVPQMNQKSGNNELSNRVNRERINGRVPDIFGKVLAVPDLVAPPFEYYSNNVEVEECLMCLGRGYHSITAVKDGDTLIELIDGAAVSFYDPGTNITEDPIYQAGARFNTAPKIAVKSHSINGQSLEKPNDAAVRGGVYFTSGGVINRLNTSIDFRNYFSVNQSIAITNAEFLEENIILSGAVTFTQAGELILSRSSDIADIDTFKAIVVTGATHYKDIETTDPVTQEVSVNRIYYDLSATYSILSATKSVSGSNFIYTIELSSPELTNPNWSHVDTDVQLNVGLELTDSIESMILDGFYTVGSVTSSSVTLTNPEDVNQDWSKLEQIFNGTTFSLATEKTILVERLNNKWVGWFDLELEGATQCVFNLTLPAGISNVTNKGEFTHAYVENWLQCEAYGEDGEKIGNTINTVAFFQDATRDQISKTFFVNLPAGTNRVRFRAAKVRAETRNSPVTETKLKSVFLTKDLDKLIYPGLTMVRSKTLATTGALSVKERRLNCIATRKVYSYSTGSQSAERIATSNFADIVCALHTDKYIGRRELSDLDVQGIYATSQEIKNYFGTPLAAHFNYTFDQGSQSFEEALAQIASCVGSNARREGSQIYFQFEKENPNSSILFNHRNKRPFTETRSEKYGVDRDHDGVEVTWIDPADGWAESIIRLPDEFITNPKKLEFAGVTNKYQAHFLAHRAWNKIQYQREMVKFTAYGEADLVSLNDRIAVVDDVVPTLTSSGDITYWQGQNISISQPVGLDPTKSYTIHLQHLNRSVETMLVTQGADEYSLVLERLPVLPLVVKSEYDEYAKYSITLSTEKDSEAFLITEKSHSGPFESEVTAINYDARYYSNDKDHIKNLI